MNVAITVNPLAILFVVGLCAWLGILQGILVYFALLVILELLERSLR